MSSRRKSKRRLEELHEPQGDVRRSPRLRERYSRERSEGPVPLTVVHTTVTSRPGLSGYMKELEQQNASILNESGQSVPAYFDLGHDDSDSRHSGHNREDIDAVAGQPFGTPDPQHLYGLDESEDGEFPQPPVHTMPPPPATPSRGGERKGVVGMLVGGVMSVLFKLGSLLYLTATAILCLDVIILHRCYMAFTAVTCWSSHAASRPWLRFWVLPVMLISLIAAMIGGGLVPTTADSPQLNITGADMDRLRSEIAASIRSTLSKDVHQHVVQHVDKVVKEWVETRLAEERNVSDEAWQQLKGESDQKGVELSRVLSEVESLERRLAEMWNQSQSTFITEALVLQVVQLQIQQQLNSAKQEWLKLVPQEMSSVTESLDGLRQELSAKDDQISKRLLALEKLVEDNNTTVTESLLQLIIELQAASESIRELMKGADSQASQLASLKAEVSELKAVGEEERREVVGRLESLEGAALSREDLARAFTEEMEKSVGSNTSVLWMWLSQELERAEEERELSTSGLTRKEVEQLIKTSLARYSADRIARFDFALENSGGLVVSSSETYPPALETYSLMGVPLWTVPSSPKAIIQPGVYPGDCWAMNGVEGYALIRLKEAVVLTGVTVEHIPKDLTPSGSLSSAPREFRILGKNETEPVHQGDTLGQFTYTLDGTPIQEFSVKDEGKAYTHILFEFLSNHGNDFYTCLYRVRVHGRPVSSPSTQ